MNREILVFGPSQELKKFLRNDPTKIFLGIPAWKLSGSIVNKFVVVEYVWKLLKTCSSGNRSSGIYTQRGLGVPTDI